MFSIKLYLLVSVKMIVVQLKQTSFKHNLKTKGKDMKRIMMAVIAAIVFSTTMMAQDCCGNQDPEKMVKHRTERMVKKYDMNDSQAEKLLALNKKFGMEQRSAMEAYEAELKGIMTEEQYAKYQAEKKDRPEGRGHRGHHGHRPPRH